MRDYADNLLRPLALRELITSRPPLVCILARKPCVRCFLSLLGWYVRFIVYIAASNSISATFIKAGYNTSHNLILSIYRPYCFSHTGVDNQTDRV